MDLQYNELDDNIRLITLNGKLDIVGTGEIETRFADYCGGQRARVVVDLSQVEYLASIGIRLLMVTAKSVINSGGKMVLLNPAPEVHHVLDVTGIPAIVPVCARLDSAQQILIAS